MIRFLVVFAGVMAVFYITAATPWFRERVYPGCLDFTASTAAAILRFMGEETVATDQNIISTRFAMQIRRGCDAMEPTALFLAAAIAFPASWRARGFAGLIGVPGLFLLNQVRIVTLYYAGIHFPRAFESLHVDIWQPLFVFLTMALWVGWAWWVTRRRIATTTSFPTP